MVLQLPVKPYSLKFLTRHLGPKYKLGKVDVYGRYLVGLLRQPRSDRRYEKFMSRYTARFPVNIVPYLVADRACKNCTPEMVIDFNTHVEGMFFAEFQQFVESRTDEKQMQVKVAIEKFCEKFKLTEDDISYETLKKNWQRYQKKEKKRQETGNSPTSLSLAA